MQDLAGMRLDVACVELGIAPTRNKASALIQKGKVCVNGEVILKSSYKINASDSITALESQMFVSRAGEKLHCFLESYPTLLEQIPLNVSRGLDIGASTGGFSEVLLQKGIASITCVDVGEAQLHHTLRENPRVVSYENTDIRDFAKNNNEKFDCIVCDVSFISLKEILEVIKKLAKFLVILLFKPQFEVGRNVKRNKKGVVMDRNVIKESLENMLGLLSQNNFKILVCAESQIKGKEGNAEFFIACQKL